MKKRIIQVGLDQLYYLAGAFFYALGIAGFAKHADFAPGGLSGLSLIINHMWNIPIGAMTLLLNIPVILICYRYVGKWFLLKTANVMLYCMVFVDVLLPMIFYYQGNPILAAVYSGIFAGVGMSVFYMRGASSGGTDFLIMAIKSVKPYLSIGSVTMTIDIAIILLGLLAFGSIDAVLYGLASTALTSIVIDKVLYGAGSGKLLMIITDKGEEIASAVSSRCRRGATISEATGAYTGNRKQILFCACSRQEVYRIREAAYEIDGNCLVMIAETSEVYGTGFLNHRNKNGFF